MSSFEVDFSPPTGPPVRVYVRWAWATRVDTKRGSFLVDDGRVLCAECMWDGFVAQVMRLVRRITDQDAAIFRCDACGQEHRVEGPTMYRAGGWRLPR